MDWLTALLRPDSAAHASVAHALLLLALVAGVGLFLGTIRIAGVTLGAAGVLFAGILFGHLGFRISPEVLELVRDFGLVLFVYTIGIQVGPGFVSSLRRQGLRLNLLAAAVVLLGVGITVAIHLVARVPAPAAVGLFSGATTNTPSLAAAQQAMQDRAIADELRALPGLGYAIAYPFGVLGIILAMAALITALPLLAVGLIGRVVCKLNYLTLCGLLSDSMTDTPALAFITEAAGSEGPSIAYASVYPLTVFLRVLSAQLLVLMFC